MESKSNQTVSKRWIALALILVLQIVGLLYMRKKFDDNITIMQSSEDSMQRKVIAIEAMLLKMQESESRVQAKP